MLSSSDSSADVSAVHVLSRSILFLRQYVDRNAVSTALIISVYHRSIAVKNSDCLEVDFAFSSLQSDSLRHSGPTLFLFLIVRNIGRSHNSVRAYQKEQPLFALSSISRRLK